MKQKFAKKPYLHQMCANPHRVRIRTQILGLLLGMAAVILLLVWVLSANLLQPRYNRFIRDMLSRRLDQTITRMDEALENGVELSRRDLSGLTINSAFWDEMNKALAEGSLTLTNCCVDISDTTLRSVMYSENLYPCLLHGSGANVFGHNNTTTERDNALVMRLRNLCFEQQELYHITETTSGSRQMVIGRTTKNGQYCVLISTSLAQVNEAGKVLGLLLPGIATFLIVPAIAVAWLFSRHVTRPLTQLSDAANQMARGNYTVRIPVPDSRQDEFGQLCRDFNHMAGQVEHSAQLQRDLLANVSPQAASQWLPAPDASYLERHLNAELSVYMHMRLFLGTGWTASIKSSNQSIKVLPPSGEKKSSEALLFVLRGNTIHTTSPSDCERSTLDRGCHFRTPKFLGRFRISWAS